MEVNVMKRLCTVLLAILLCMAAAVPALAAENENVDVIVKYVKDIAGEYSATVKNGNAEVDAGGVSVSITGAPAEAVRLVVVPVPKSETEAWKWFSTSMEKVGTPLAVYDIYFVDEAGTRLSASGAKVTIDTPSYSGELILCSLASDGKPTTLESTTKRGKTTFAANDGSYFALAEKKASTSGSTKPSTTPSTGDQIWFWGGLGLSALLVLLILIIWKRKKDKTK